MEDVHKVLFRFGVTELGLIRTLRLPSGQARARALPKTRVLSIFSAAG